MIEQRWLASTNPEPMLHFLGTKASHRKLRLFGLACCRHAWEEVREQQARDVVALAERYVDGGEAEATLRRAVKAMPMPEWPGTGPDIFNWKLVTGHIAADVTDIRTFIWLTAETSNAELTLAMVADRWAEDGTRFVPPAIQAGILRDVFNPLRDGVTVASTGDVNRLAEAAYQERRLPEGTLDPSRLAVLADALEEGGVSDSELLAHLRSEGPHYRGCWALDCVLGRA